MVPKKLSATIEKQLKKQFDISLTESKKLAQNVRQLSQYYINRPLEPTPWHEKWCQIAQLAYFLPLNYLRIKAAWQRLPWRLPLEEFDHWFDFGCGLSPMGWFIFLEQETSSPRIYLHDQSNRPLQMLSDMGLSFSEVKNDQQMNALKHGQGGLSATFSLTENTQRDFEQWAQLFPFLFILEPGLREDGRRLLKLRDYFLSLNYFPLAPCTHSLACPLLKHSSSDWCHDKVNVELPDWLLEMHQHLPFKNESLTFCYLFLSQQEHHQRQHHDLVKLPHPKARVIGDPLPSKGKIQQAICFNDTRTFLSRLTRSHTDHTYTDRGSLVSLPKEFDLLGSPSHYELRMKP